ncbi:cupin [Kibdelosporangium persicum]|uniref:Cupin domain-containing protein n=1 Tax=Kibdelosporangium persicum TaxID=2698649 RepID=A0ABX2EZU6_9PSEU|nr:cupin [Kibdelosporangium persicum]NRN64492.1 Cupin domain-containing protein [Kibdelosporangium persicum]
MDVEPVIFPGATGISGLSVYPWEAEDGRCGGSPHVHLTCTEAYITVSGSGSLQTLTGQGLSEHPLIPGTVVWFGPGTIHRAVNVSSLRVIVVMQNSGLPEAGDAVLTYPPQVLADPVDYHRGRKPRERRDLAVRGFLDLARDPGALAKFYQQAAELVADRLDSWEARWEAGPLESVRQTQRQLNALRAGNVDYLMDSEVRVAEAPAQRAYGMCGMLDVYRL